ncbi:MoaD/ThiS family protein [Candidatus Woesearchaeota archaeon]|nr:MoaD/ThiS family protein [Candidatus Woesearchaeota archaeon]
MKVFVERSGQWFDIDIANKKQFTVKKLVSMLGLNIEEVLVVKNKVIVSEREVLKNDDVVEFLSVVSGG